MKIACLLGRWSLTIRKSMNFATARHDPRGLTGTEWAVTRIAEELAAAGHDVQVFTVSEEKAWNGVRVHPIDEIAAIDDSYDAAVSFNEPDLLRLTTPKLRVCEHYLNDVGYCAPGFAQYVDLWVSPSEAHRCMLLEEPTWSKSTSASDRSKWCVNPLGCDPERFEMAEKIPGRVIYASSPDRGLHWVLHYWPRIRQEVPWATLKVFYRLQGWIDTFRHIPYSPVNERMQGRALFIEECLRRMQCQGVEACDSVSRDRIEREMSEAEVLAYPCDPVTWTEGFSCSVLESCAARACPVISSADALGPIYGGVVPMVQRGNWDEWADTVIMALKDAEYRGNANERAHEFARGFTWKTHAKRLELEIRDMLRLN